MSYLRRIMATVLNASAEVTKITAEALTEAGSIMRDVAEKTQKTK